jgi:hypothetical protein
VGVGATVCVGVWNGRGVAVGVIVGVVDDGPERSTRTCPIVVVPALAELEPSLSRRIAVENVKVMGALLVGQVVAVQSTPEVSIQWDACVFEGPSVSTTALPSSTSSRVLKNAEVVDRNDPGR